MLSIFHYVLGAMTFGVACLFLLYLITNVMTMGQLSPEERARLPESFGQGFNRAGVIGLAVGWTIAALNAISGWCLSRRRFRGVSLLAAAVNLLWPPVGTVFGAITIVILLRKSVRRLYR